MRSRKLDRRTLLRGAGALVLALPALEIMGASRASAGPATSPPKRYVLSYGGMSIGRYIDGKGVDGIAPATTGAGYTPSYALAPLTTFGVADAVSVVTGLTIPWETNGQVPPGGRIAAFHFGPTVTPQLCGVRAISKAGPRGPTSDRLVADAIAGDTRVLAYRVQPVNYNGGDQTAGNSGRLSWQLDGSGQLQPMDPMVSPREAFTSLFSGFVPQDDPAKKAAAEFLLAERKSVLDLVADDAKSLMSRLGAADRDRMQRHYDEVRALEKRLYDVPAVGGACQIPPQPGDDPPIGGSLKGDSVQYSTSAGYSDEDLRAELLCDMIRMAFACDLSRVATLMLTMWKCYMNAYPVTPGQWQTDVHEISHSGLPIDATGDAIAWHVKHFARLAHLLDKTPEVDGTTLLDHTAMVLIFEGGFGFDPETGGHSAHSSENMAVLVGGRAGGLNQPSKHIVATGKHPVQAILSAMKAVGYTGDACGEVSGEIPELFG